MENMRAAEWGIKWHQAPLVVDQVGVVRDIHWVSYLVLNMNMREDLLVRCKGRVS